VRLRIRDAIYILTREAFFWGLNPGKDIDQTLFVNAIHESDEYENVIWWIVATLCRESHLAWLNAEDHLETLIKTWVGI
jgi:hypothetical protein